MKQFYIFRKIILVVVAISLFSFTSKIEAQNCIDSTLIDTSIVCPTLLSPVCGCDGVTYPNVCVGQFYHGVTSFAIGPCSINCEAAFTWTTVNISTSLPTPGKIIQFTDSSSSNVISWNWSFGDGTGSNLQNPAHKYLSPGDYIVCLTAFALGPQSLSCTVTYCDTITIDCVDSSHIQSVPCPLFYQPVCGCDGVTYGNACEAYYYGGVCFWTNGPCGFGGCDVDFSWQYITTGINSVGQPVQFTDQSLSQVISWSWDFGDGDGSNVQNPAHIYRNPGTYVACLTIAAIDSPLGIICTAVICDTLEILCQDSSLIDPTIACPAIYDPVCGCDSVTYSNACVAEYANGVRFWTPGPCGIPSICTADFDWQLNNAAGLYNGNFVQFTDQSSSNIVARSWDFGDGSSSTMINPDHLYSDPGTYIVCLTVVGTASSGAVCTVVHCDTLVLYCIDSSLMLAIPCPGIYDPVCGCDGNTYSNSCEARFNYGVTSWTLGPCGAYCPSFASNSSVGWIQRVGPNTSGNNGGYALFNFCNAGLNAGSTVSIPLLAGVNNPPSNARARWRVWADFNGDQDFDDPGELVWQGGGTTPTAVVTIPPTACAGCTRIRFVLSNQFQSACGPFGFGETEDYMVTILSNTICRSGIAQETSLEPFAKELGQVAVDVFPNPARDFVNMSVHSSTESGPVSIELFSIEGKQVYLEQFEGFIGSTNITIPISEFTNGIYQLVVKTSEGTSVKKLVVTK